MFYNVNLMYCVCCGFSQPEDYEKWLGRILARIPRIEVDNHDSFEERVQSYAPLVEQLSGTCIH